MKLNLLPQSVSKAGAARGALIAAVVLALAGIAIGAGLVAISAGAKAVAKNDATDKQKLAADAKATADQADAQIAAATTITRNQKLAEAMNEHNRKYVELYRDILRYVPAYYRVTSLSAVPQGENLTTVTVSGYLDSYRQYADLSIALWKIPDAVSVSRAGYEIDSAAVPALTEADQLGAPIKPGESPLPSDPLERMEALQARAASEPEGFLNQGGFGTLDDTNRGAMPGFSQVTMTVNIARDMRTPDPRATITAGATAGGNSPAPGFSPTPTRAEGGR